MIRDKDVLSFWFGDPDLSWAKRLENQATLWFSQSKILYHYLPPSIKKLSVEAMRGNLSSWEKTPQGRLALIILLQWVGASLPGTGSLHFHQRKYSLILCLKNEADAILYDVIERVFFFYPLITSDDRILLEKIVDIYAHLILKTPAEIRTLPIEMYERSLKALTYNKEHSLRFCS